MIRLIVRAERYATRECRSVRYSSVSCVAARRKLQHIGGTRHACTLHEHNRAVEQISHTVSRYYQDKVAFRINHGSTNSTRALAKDSKTVNLCELRNVLEINIESRTALVQPNVPMDRLIEATLPYGLVPPVVMDFPGITVGGGYAGTAGESSSFRHGFFDQTMNWVEIVLGDGQVVRCSPAEKQDLFHAAAGAVGSLGVATLFELQLVKATTHVELTYVRVSSVREATAMIEQCIDEPRNDYVDGIMYSQDQGVVVLGRRVDANESVSAVQTFSRPRDPWFYLHARSRIEQSHSSTELVPLADYLFRYDRAGFWVGKMAFDYLHFPCTPWTRRFLDDFLHTRMLYTALHASGVQDSIIIQDLAMPYCAVDEFVQWQSRELDIWPLWLCPLKTPTAPSFHPQLTRSGRVQTQKDNRMLSVGLWGFLKPPQTSKYHSTASSPQEMCIKAEKGIEQTLSRLGGRKWLYAQTYYDEHKFWDMYGGREWYDALRTKYHATTLPSVYDKVRSRQAKKEIKDDTWSTYLQSCWPIPAIRGLRKAIQSRDYIQARSATWRNMKIGHALKRPVASKSSK